MPSGFYQPSITRLPSLLCLLLVTLLLIALTELAVRRLPAHNAAGIITSLDDKASAKVSAIVHARHADPYPQDSPPVAPGAPPPDDFLGVEAASSSTAGPTPTPNGDDFLPVAASTATPTSEAAPTNFLPVVASSTSSTSAPPAAVFLPVQDSTTTSSSAPPLPTIAATTPPPGVTLSAAPNSKYLSLVNSITPTIPVNPTTQSSIPQIISTSEVISSSPVLPASSSMTTSYRTGEAAGEKYSLGPNGLVIIAGTTFTTGNPTTATLGDGNVVVVGPTGAVSIQEAQEQETSNDPTSVTPRDYILGMWIPTIIAVLFSIPWHLLASAIKEIEPFYQLHSVNGVSAKDSLALDYGTSITIVATLNAIKKRHYLVWWSGLISLLILVIAPLASETVFIGFSGTCTATSGRSECFPKLSIYPVAARVVQGILSFIAIITFALAIAIMQRKSGVYANPLSIAGLATLFQDQRVVEDFRRLNAYSPNSRDIRNALRGNRYRVGPYNQADGTSYGLTIVHSNAAQVDEDRRTSSLDGKKYTSVSVNPVEEVPNLVHKKPNSNLWIHPAVLALFALFILGLEALVIYYNRTGGDSGFERFMDSATFGVSFLFTAIGVVLKMYWTLLDDEFRTMEPYRQLLHGDAKAVDSILLAPRSNPFTGFFHSLRHGHFFNSYISLVAILCEPLIVALANIPFKPGSNFLAYKVATSITVAVLFLMLIGIVWMLCRRRTPGMMRRPDTIASVLLALCGSHILGEFSGMAMMDGKTRDRTVNDWDKRYAMGRLIGVDGVEREGVDESMFVGVPQR